MEDLLRRLQPGDAPPRPSFIRDLIGVRAPGNIRDNPRVAEDLRRFERPSGFEQLKRQFLGDGYSRLEWPPGSIPPLGVADNPIFTPEVWARLSGLAPFLMPAGPDDSTEVLGPGPRGGAMALRNPIALQWDNVSAGSGEDAGATSCFLPRAVDAARIAPVVYAARLHSVLLAAMGRAIERDPAGRHRIYRSSACSDETGANLVAHCSGLLDADGRTVWTAAHCLRNADLGFFLPTPTDLPVGRTMPCSDDADLRVVSLLGLASEDFSVEPEMMRPCESIVMLGPDIAQVRLAAPLPVMPRLPPDMMPWRHLRPGEGRSLLRAGRRVYGTGYQQSPVLRESVAGRLLPVVHCSVTLAARLGYLGARPEMAEIEAARRRVQAEVPEGALTHGGYGCMTLDTRNGGSGGPVFAITDDSADLVLVGVASSAAWTGFDMECGVAPVAPLDDACGAETNGNMNLFAVLPELPV